MRFFVLFRENTSLRNKVMVFTNVQRRHVWEYMVRNYKECFHTILTEPEMAHQFPLLHSCTDNWVKQGTECIEHTPSGTIRYPLDLTDYVDVPHKVSLKVYRQKALEIYGVNLGQEHLFDDCLNWFKICKPYPSKEDLQTQTGAVLEEIGEFLISLGLDASVINTYAKEFYTKQKEIPEDTKVDQLDAIGDILVTLTGFSYMQKFNLKGAFEEINLSNASKLEDGKPVFNEQGKIAKGKDYFKPNLEQYV